MAIGTIIKKELTKPTRIIEIKCGVGGVLYGGKALCGYVTLGGKLCTIPCGECEHQVLPV